MIETLTILLRIAGVGLILLAGLHVPMGNHLKWRAETARLSPANQSIFHGHTFFICLGLVMMGLPCLLEPSIFLVNSRAGTWLAWLLSAFWAIRLFYQWFVYPWSLWRGKTIETVAHFWFTVIWFSLAALFAICGMWQSGWLHH